METVEILMFAVGFDVFLVARNLTFVLRIPYGIPHTAVDLIDSVGFSQAQVHIGLKRNAVGSRVCRGNIFFFPISALAHLHGVFFRVTQYLRIRRFTRLRFAWLR